MFTAKLRQRSLSQLTWLRRASRLSGLPVARVLAHANGYSETPAVQFLSADLAAQGEPFVGKKITVQGTVTKIDTSDPQSAWIYLDNGVRCNLGKFQAMAAESSVGDTVSVDGFLISCEDGDVLLEPAMLRDPTAPFSPE